MNPKLQDAVAVFKELGWEKVAPDNVLDLPTGTAEQKRIALAGLKSGEWGEYKMKGNTICWHSYIDVDEGKLALFAVRIGVRAQRAANILHGEMSLDVISARGAKYAFDFIGYACVSSRRAYEHSASAYGKIAVRLVDKLHLDIPQNVEYMKDWSVYAAAAMKLEAEIHHGETNLPELDLIEKRFVEHIVTGVAVNAPATGPFGAVLPAGVKRSWLSCEKAMELTFLALDASVRPGDRKVWLGVLDELDISDEELCARTQALIPLLASGDATVVNRLAPVLIKLAESELLVEIIVAAFSVTTKKARKAVLKTALERSCPKNAEEITPWLSILAGDNDKTISSLATQLMKQWEIHADMLPEENTEIQGLWQETPPVWKVPSFDLGEVSPEALTELAAKLVNQPFIIHDVTAERFLAMANAVAYQNPEAARNSLRGLRPGESPFLNYVACWVKEETPFARYDDNGKRVHALGGEKDALSPIEARDYIVSMHLGEVPCILSTPSVVDLSIHVSDLATRIALYKEVGTSVQEADLLLALTRLDTKTKTPEAIEELRKLNVPVVLHSGKKMPVTAGQAALKYIENPIKEQPFSKEMSSYWDYWHDPNIKISDALHGFPNRFKGYVEEPYSIFPLWGDVTLIMIRGYGYVYYEQALVLRQVARRATSLTPGVSMNILAAQRSVAPDVAEDSLRAVSEAWERGLLRPGIADIAFLDWSTNPPSHLVALSEALECIARDGLLSVVWPILDDLICASLKAPRLFAGTAALAELMASLLPEVQFAIKQGKAEHIALELPSIRRLARRKGSSHAVTAAQKVAALLPPAQEESEQEEKYVPVMDLPFDKVWHIRKKEVLLIDDGVKVKVSWGDVTTRTQRMFLFTLILPGITDRVFQVVKGWCYDLEYEGQCVAHVATPDAVTFVGYHEDNEVWLYWDVKQKAIVVKNKRDWFQNSDSSLKESQPSTLPFSLLTVVIGLLAQDGDMEYSAPALLREFIKRRQIDEKVVRKATQILLQNPVVSPAKLMRAVEKDIKLLPVLWPMLAECTKAAGALVASSEKPPVWVNRILDTALRYAPYLVEAAKRGLIPAEDAQWTGLSEIASSKSKSAAVTKAKKLLTLLGKE